MANLPFPLNIPGDKEFQTLCKMLWNWNICAACAKGTQSCHELECAWQQRSYKLKSLFNYYKALSSSYVPESLLAATQAVASHDDLLAII